ncbi:MAG: Bax inhibitor-1/YccA family protein [Bacteroidetes bacterium]|nr:Bax inhibitor-1/YccA family protein [Bacteroidota bacterium]
MNEMQDNNLTLRDIQLEQARFMTRVYTWMAFALTITGAIAYIVAGTPSLVYAIVSNQLLFFGLIIAEIVLVGYLATAVAKMSAQRATALFIGYAVLNGLTLSVIFLAYTLGSIASTFFVTAGTFGIMSAYGYFTKKDLTSMGNLLMMALLGLIIASVVNIFLKSEMLYWIATYAGILIFVGLTAYDTQKIKNMNIIGNEGTEEDRKEAVMGALILYLDFINLFLMLLRLFGRRK